MKGIIRYYLAALCACCVLTSVANASVRLNINDVYNMQPQKVIDKINDYTSKNMIDSAMMCASVLVNKYGREGLTRDEVGACCAAYRYMGVNYMMKFYDYHLAAQYLLKAEQIAQENDFVVQHAIIAEDLAILTATRSDIESNFAYNPESIEAFKKLFRLAYNNIQKGNREFIDARPSIFNDAFNNLAYLAFKYGKTEEIKQEIKYFKSIQQPKNRKDPVIIVRDVAEQVNAKDYDRAIQLINIAVSDSMKQQIDRNDVQPIIMCELIKYYVLEASNKTYDAEMQLLKIESMLREHNYGYELLEVLQQLKTHYEKHGNATMAIKYKLLYYESKDEFFNNSGMSKVDQAKLKFEIDQYNERIQEMIDTNKRQSMMLIGVAIIAVFALVILSIIYSNFRRIKKKNEALYIKNVELLNVEEKLATVEISAETTSNEPTEEESQLLESILGIMHSSTEIYTEKFTINRLAELVGSNRTYVSQVINEHKHCNFSSLLNEYRIKEACRRLLDNESYGAYTIEAIAHSVGYKSRANFASVFKEFVGMSPSTFQKMSRK